MKTIYTLREKIDDKTRGVLNGRIFMVKKSDDGTAAFVDVYTNKILLLTSTVENVEYTAFGVNLTTKNFTYNLLDIKSLIRTTETCTIESNEISEEIDVANLKYEIVEEDHKPIRYGDGYDLLRFKFETELTETEFIDFIENVMHRTVKEKGAWYEEYSIIEGQGKEWTYKWIRVYTD